MATNNPLILLIDDVSSFLQTVQKASRFLDLDHVRIARSFSEARERLAEDDYDRIISDWRMPDGDGILFLLEQKIRNPDTECVLLTGWTQTLISKIGENAISELEDRGIAVFSKANATVRMINEVLTGPVPKSTIDPASINLSLVGAPSPEALHTIRLAEMGKNKKIQLAALLGISSPRRQSLAASYVSDYLDNVPAEAKVPAIGGLLLAASTAGIFAGLGLASGGQLVLGVVSLFCSLSCAIYGFIELSSTSRSNDD